MIGDDSLSIDITRANFIKDISAARTFGFHQDAVRLQRLGLALGANLKNTVVFGSTSVMNSEGLRWPNEPVRHKILDMIGDLALAGAPIVAKVRGYCSGHSLNHALVSQLMATPTAWKWSHQ
jgi:UDP-3-O-[3-hydroxymyristoyl] N-acetylglucosamine deacetylase